jgi:hypothetical protein
MARRLLPLFVFLLALAAPVRADEDAPGPADLKVTVLDQTGAALVTATVTVINETGAARTYPVDPRGQVALAALSLGTYTVKVEADAFQSFEGPLTLKKGANAVTVTLPLAGLSEDVVVRTDSNDTSGNAFTSSLSEQEIAELPDDPDELEQVLLQMAGPGATMRVNGFRGGRLPPKNQIQSIRFRMNSYAADNHEAGGGFGIDIVTKPGMDGWRGMTNFGFRDETFNARNAFAPTLGAEQYRRFGFNIDGPLVKGRTSLSINVDGNANYDSQTINAQTPAGGYNDVVRRPNDRVFASVRVDHQLTPTQQMRIEFRGQFAGRREDQRLGAAARLADHAVQQRQHERGGLATSGRGTGQEVASLQGGWNGGRLDGRRSRETKFFDALKQARVEIQRVERHDTILPRLSFGNSRTVAAPLAASTQRLRARITTRYWFSAFRLISATNCRP